MLVALRSELDDALAVDDLRGAWLHHAASICSFSGMEDWTASGDHPRGGIAVTPGVTQTPHFVEGFYPPPGTPGYECNPSGKRP